MKYTALAGAFFAAALIASPLFAFAKAGDPIPGLSIGLEGDPGSVVIAQAKTNSAGVAVFQNVKPGKYQLTVYVAGASGEFGKPRTTLRDQQTEELRMKIHGRRRSKSTSRGKPRLSEPFLKPGPTRG
jgi:hypothetical protein